MGLFRRNSWLSGGNLKPTDPQPDFVNPNPHDYTILKCIKVNRLYISKIKYPNCLNYEGEKILLTVNDPRQVGSKGLDPHFINPSEDTAFLGLLARFRPDDLGWEMAKHLALTFPLGN